MPRYTVNTIRKPDEGGGGGWLGVLGAVVGAAIATVATGGAAAPAGIGAVKGVTAGVAAGSAATAAGTAAGGAAVGLGATKGLAAGVGTGMATGTAKGLGSGAALGSSIGTTSGKLLTPNLASVLSGNTAWLGPASKKALAAGADVVRSTTDKAVDAALEHQKEEAAKKLAEETPDTWEAMKRFSSKVQDFTTPIEKGHQLGSMADAAIRTKPIPTADNVSMPTPNASQTLAEHGGQSEHLQKAMQALATRPQAEQDEYGPRIQEALKRSYTRGRA